MNMGIRFRQDHLVRKRLFITFLLIVSGNMLIIFLTRSSLSNLYFHGFIHDSGMDYFNTLQASTSNPYSGDTGNYPPMCYLLLRIIHYFVPANTPNAAQSEPFGGAAFYLRNTEYSFLPYAYILIISCLIIAYCVYRFCNNNFESEKLYAVSIVFASGPMLYLIERGNILLLALVGVFIYMTCRLSSNRLVRLLGYIGISFAAAIKIYPFIFSFIELRNHKWKNFILILLLTVCLYIVPFIYFGGVSAVIGFIRGLTQFTTDFSSYGHGLQYSVANLILIIFKFFNIDAIQTISPLITGIILLLSIAGIFLSQNDTDAYLLCGILCVAIPSISFTYSLVFILPGIIQLFVSKDTTIPVNILILSLLLMAMTPFIAPLVPLENNIFGQVNYPLTWGCLIQNIMMYVSLFILLFKIFRYQIRINRINRSNQSYVSKSMSTVSSISSV